MTNKWSNKIAEEEATAFASLPAGLKLTYMMGRLENISKDVEKIFVNCYAPQKTYVSLDVFANVYSDVSLLQQVADSIITQYQFDWDGTWHDVTFTVKHLVRFMVLVHDVENKDGLLLDLCKVCAKLFDIYGSALVDILQSPRRSCSFANLKKWEECPVERLAYLIMWLKD